MDYLRNTRGAKAVGVYSTRARAGAPVSVPMEWGELDRLSGPTDFTVAEPVQNIWGSDHADIAALFERLAGIFHESRSGAGAPHS